MKTETKSLVAKINTECCGVDAWFVIEKGERRGWIFKYYLLLYNPKKGELAYYKANHGEYILMELGTATTHPSLDRLSDKEQHTP